MKSDPSKNWIHLHRNLLINELWLSEPFTDGQAWVDLLLVANHSQGYIKVRGIHIEIQRGQVGWSKEKLAERWKWSRGKVLRFLKYLASNKMVEMVQQNNNVTTLISIVNYDRFQGGSTTDGTTDGQQTVQQTDTNKKNKECEEGKEVKIRAVFQPPNIETVAAYCIERNNGVSPDKWHNHYQSNGWMIGKNKMKDWKAAVRTWEKESKPEQERLIY